MPAAGTAVGAAGRRFGRRGGGGGARELPEREYAAGREAVITTILCDSAEKYMSERFWNDPQYAAELNGKVK